MKIVDCFMFFNELDLLEARLEYLDPIVDHFVLVEAKFTQLGKEKELYYLNNINRFKKYVKKIVHVVVKTPITQEYCSWKNENHQRNQIQVGLDSLKLEDNDIVIISDLDEIPSKDAIELFKSKNESGPFALNQDMYYYYLNWKAPYKWQGSIIATSEVVNNYSSQSLRNIREKITRLPVHGGWHFSYLGGAEAVLTKINSVCESDCHENYKSVDILKNAIEKQTLHFNNQKLEQIDIDSIEFPENIKNNKQLYLSKGLLHD